MPHPSGFFHSEPLQFLQIDILQMHIEGLGTQHHLSQ